jgi:hypothetical protein
MSRSSLTLAAILILASSVPVHAQDNPAPIEPLLRNDDPRLVALGAWEMARRDDDTEIAILQEKVESWDSFQRHRNQNEDRYDAMTVILDTLIQRDKVVSPAGLTAIAYAFPNQALILASRLPFEDAEPLLLSWYENGEGVSRADPDRDSANRLMSARVSAMILAIKHPQEIAASVLADSVERLVVSVPSDGFAGMERCLVGCVTTPPWDTCVNEIAGPQQAGWPPIFQYILSEYRPYESNPNPNLNDPLLIKAGGDIITYRRVKAGRDLHYCHSPSPLSAETRHHLLAQLLGVGDRQMQWGAQVNVTLPWVSDEQYLRYLSSQVEAEVAKLQATARALHAKGLLTKNEMESTRPKLSVIVFDDRQPAQPANLSLPPLPVQDSRTTYRISPWR